MTRAQLQLQGKRKCIGKSNVQIEDGIEDVISEVMSTRLDDCAQKMTKDDSPCVEIEMC